MSISFDQKNKNILNRFEAKEGSTCTKRYQFKIDGKPVTMLDMKGEDTKLQTQKLYERWGNRISEISTD